MRQGAPTNADPLDSETWANLQEEARRSGLPFGEWLKARLLGDTPAAAARPAAPRVPAMGDLQRRVADLAGEIDRLAGIEPPPVPHRGSRAAPVTGAQTPAAQMPAAPVPAAQMPGGESLATALDSLNARIETLLRDPDKGSPAAATHLDETVRRLNERLESIAASRRAAAFTRPAAGEEPQAAPRSMEAAPRSFEERMGDVARTVEQLSRRLSAPPVAAPAAAAPASATPAPATPAPRPSRDPALDAAVNEIAARQRRLDGEPAPAVTPAAPTPTVSTPAPAAAAPAADLSWLERQLNTISDQMAELTRASGTDAVTMLRGDLAEMRRTLGALAPLSAVEELERAVVDVGQKLDRSGAGAMNGEVAATLAELSTAIETLRGAQGPQVLAGEIEALSRKLDIVSAKTVDGATIARLQAQTSEIRDLLGRALSNDTARLLAEQVALLVGRMEHISSPDENLAREVVEVLGARIDDLASRIEAHSDRHRASPDDGSIGFEEIVRRLDDLHATVADAAGAAPHGMEKMFDALMARIETLARGDAASAEAVAALGSRMTPEFSSQMSSEVASQVSAQLGTQIAAIAERIEATDSRFAQLAGIERALDDLFVQMEEARSGLIASAEQSARSVAAEIAAAEIAARPADARPGMAEGMVEGMAMLQRELADLGIRQENSERRTYDTLETVHETLERVVDRIASLETGAPLDESEDDDFVLSRVLSTPAAAPVSAPSASSREPLREPAVVPRAPAPHAGDEPAFPDDFPLEPGSGLPRHRSLRDEWEPAAPSTEADELDMPVGSHGSDPGDIAPDVVATRGEDEPGPGPSRADFIAAARRAAQTAGGTRPKTEENGTKEGGFKLSRLLSRARLPLLVGVCGSAMALAGWQYAGSLGAFKPGALNLQAMLPFSGDAPQDSAQAGLPVEKDTATLPRPASSVAGAEISAQGVPASGVLASPSTFGLQPAAGGQSAASAAAPRPDPSEVTGSVPSNSVPVLPVLTPGASLAPVSAPVAELPNGIGGPTLRAAARAGDPAAAYEVGARFAEGRGVSPNAARAADWFAFAVARGSIPAGYRLGVLLEKGAAGVDRDVERARNLYSDAARAGNVRAMHNLGVLLAEGIDGQPSYVEAALWFRRAAERGVRDSQYNLGVLYTRGLGVKADLAEAWKWFSLAAAQGDADAGRKRDEVASRLDPQELVTLRFAVQTWSPVATDDKANVALVNPDWDRAETSTKRAKTARL